MAKIDWKFNGVDTIDSDGGTQFSFKLERYKDSDTYEESLKIYSIDGEKDNGFIITSIFNLSRDIEKLKKYGVLLSAIDFRDIEKLIEANYLKLEPVTVSLDSDTRFDELIEAVKEHMNGNKDMITNDLCYILVNDFNDLVKDCGFYEYEMRALRGQLKDKGYILTKGNRYAIPARIKKDKVVRAIAFKRDKLGIELPADKKSDADE